MNILKTTFIGLFASGLFIGFDCPAFSDNTSVGVDYSRNNMFRLNEYGSRHNTKLQLIAAANPDDMKTNEKSETSHSINNLFDKNRPDIIKNQYVQYNDGKKHPDERLSYIILECKPDTDYVINTRYCHIAFFDGVPDLEKRSNHLGGLATTDLKTREFHTPPKGNHLIISFPTTATNTLYIVENTNPHIIEFDASNIKQYWTSNSVLSDKEIIIFLLEAADAGKWKSIPLKIQLANVSPEQFCKISITTDTPNVSFDVLDDKSKVLSSSFALDSDTQNIISSTPFQLKTVKDLSFNIVFSSKENVEVRIKNITLFITRNN